MEKDPQKIDINEFTYVIKIKDEGDLRATVILQYKNLKIKGFRIVRSKYKNNDLELWLQVPSYRAGNFYKPMFFLEDKEDWAKVEAKIFEDYKKKSNEYFGKKMGVAQSNVEPEINIDDITF